MKKGCTSHYGLIFFLGQDNGDGLINFIEMINHLFSCMF